MVVCISTGAFESMRHDLEIPERHGIKQSVGDTVGPGGVMRVAAQHPGARRIARDMEELCPDVWMLNITNPMTTLCRAVTRETSVKTVGLCHEITGAQFTLSQILDVDFRSFDFEVVGVNHLPIITALRIDGEDAMDRLREKLADPEKLADEPIYLPDEIRRELGDVAGGVHQARSRHEQPGEVRPVRALRRAARRRRPSPRRVLPRIPHRGVGVGEAVGRRPHVDRRPRGVGRPLQGRVREAARDDRGAERCRRARWSRR